MAKSQRLVSALNGVVAVGLVAVLAAVALVVKPPAPPGIAEFAPQASKPITKAPAGQAAMSGEGPGQGVCFEGEGCRPTPRPSASVSAPRRAAAAGGPVGVPSALQCYEWPDGSVTQTFDPQSPPCIASWPEADQGNGGVTTAGVTATEIRIAVPGVKARSENAQRAIRALERFFNSHYQFYGRQLRLIAVPNGPSLDPSGQKAAAESVAETKPFAALDEGYSEKAHRRRILVNKKIITTTVQAATLTQEELLKSRPYLWSFGPTREELQSGFVEFACKNLRGTADYAGPDSLGKPRRFAIVHGGSLPQDIVVGGLEGCTGERPGAFDYSDPACGTATTTMLDQLKNTGVTTIILHGTSVDCLYRTAAKERYEPEWAFLPISYYSYRESYMDIRREGKRQSAHTFGIAPSNKLLPYRNEPAYRAVTTVDPTLTPWSSPRNDASNIDDPEAVRATYQQLLMLASGIQMAGPRLTPQSLAQALEETRFPNPGAAGPDWYQASVGFGTGDHTFVDDLGVWWFSLTHRSTNAYGGPDSGGFCYVQKGRRWLPGQWPSDLVLRDAKTCR